MTKKSDITMTIKSERDVVTMIRDAARDGAFRGVFEAFDKAEEKDDK